MGPVGAVIIYLIVWWAVFFAVLPWGMRGTWEDPNSGPKGADQGAPIDPRLKKKFIQTSLISLGIWAVVCLVIISGVIDYRD